MPRATRTLASSEPRGRIVDTLILNSAQRRATRGVAIGVNGTQVELELPAGMLLRTDDALLLDTGDAVEIVSEAEPLFELRGDVPALTQIAWALGDRHIAVQILPNRIRFRRDAVGEGWIGSLGGKIAAIDAPFEPEAGAYATMLSHDGHSRGGHHHEHGHGHRHDDRQEHHSHDHHGHDH